MKAKRLKYLHPFFGGNLSNLKAPFYFMSRIRGNLQSLALQGAWRLQNSKRVSFFNFGAVPQLQI